jgi:hypothetical protein
MMLKLHSAYATFPTWTPSSSPEFTLLPLFEIFSKFPLQEAAKGLARLHAETENVCRDISPVPWLDNLRSEVSLLCSTPRCVRMLWNADSPEEFIDHSSARFSTSDKWPILQRLFGSFQDRLTNPEKLVTYLRNLPSPSTKSYFAYKMMQFHLEANKMRPSDFIETVHETGDIYIILWRRRMIESFVSHQIALQSHEWSRADTSGRVVRIVRKDLEEFLTKRKNYYIRVWT